MNKREKLEHLTEQAETLQIWLDETENVSYSGLNGEQIEDLMFTLKSRHKVITELYKVNKETHSLKFVKDVRTIETISNFIF